MKITPLHFFIPKNGLNIFFFFLLFLVWGLLAASRNEIQFQKMNINYLQIFFKCASNFEGNPKIKRQNFLSNGNITESSL